MSPQYQVDLGRVANEVINEGLHLFTIVDTYEGEGGAGPYWSFTCASATPGEEGKTTRLILSLSPQSRWKLELFLDAVGAPEKGKATIEKFVGRQFKGQVVHGEYQGRKQANIQEMFPVNSATPVAKSAATPVVVKSAEVVEKSEPETKPLPEDVKSDGGGDIPF